MFKALTRWSLLIALVLVAAVPVTAQDEYPSGDLFDWVVEIVNQWTSNWTTPEDPAATGNETAPMESGTGDPMGEPPVAASGDGEPDSGDAEGGDLIEPWG